MYINIYYINMCRLNKNREQRKEWEKKGVGVVCVIAILMDHLVNKNNVRPLYTFKHALKNNFVHTLDQASVLCQYFQCHNVFFIDLSTIFFTGA